MIVIFIIGYLAIALEHPIKINKAASALLLALILWILFGFSGFISTEEVLKELEHHFSSISQLLFFLMGAMTIVELISRHNGFKVVTDAIRTTNKRTLLWIIGFVTFFLSSVLDNMTTAIVITTLLGKLLDDKNDKMIFAGIVIIAANAGGAWTPIGDVTTTMLWIGGQITTLNIMKELFIPSMMCLIVPLLYQSFFIRGTFSPLKGEKGKNPTEPASKLMFYLGISALMFVPIFKAITHLPPYMGMLLGVGVLWFVTDWMHHAHEDRTHLRITHVLTRIDVPSILFFLGILLAVGALETSGILQNFAVWMDQRIGNKDIIVTIIGLLSAIMDNIPLTAATMGMYDLTTYPADHKIWKMLAYSVGTGGSCLIIGSAAGVVTMGIAKLDFIWYMKKISFTALLGYFAGILAYLAIYPLTSG
jgi:Na+/H+ antiporter NhaD and related arsenite permeases